MSSRDEILLAVGRNKPAPVALPAIPSSTVFATHLEEHFRAAQKKVGGRVIDVANVEEIRIFLRGHYKPSDRLITILPELNGVAELHWPGARPHELANVELTIVRAHFGVAENGAVWVTDTILGHRAAPFLCQHLAVILRRQDVVPTLHEAYSRIGGERYGFGAFIAGPSKTADIEQSLVVGAHGPKSMTVFLLSE